MTETLLRGLLRPHQTDRCLRARLGFLLVALLPLAQIFQPPLAVASSSPDFLPSTVVPPRPEREFRAAWIATVANIDWPSKRTLTTEQQKQELLDLLDRAARLRLNAVIFQVRPSCDALYPSQLEPWSEYLTGTMGKPPEPYYDPLQFAIDEAHKRGLELHAWFNPYRARHPTGKSPVAPSHISKTHPELVRQYGKSLWLDPGDKAVQDYFVRVLTDVVSRYSLDGICIDDYFYPYPEKDAGGNDLPFPDEATWKRFGAGTKLSRDDWRRDNVNTLIERVYKMLKITRPSVKFGISPFGIWRPGVPATIDRHGYDAFSRSYADPKKWLENGWLDYLSPQLYWPIEDTEHSFSVLLKWWQEQNPKHRYVWPSLDTTKTAAKWKPDEVLNQIRLLRKEGEPGHIHWNMHSLLRSNEFTAELQRTVYGRPALVPAFPWLRQEALPKPELRARRTGGSKVVCQWQTAGSGDVWLWLLQYKRNGQWTTELLPARIKSRTFEKEAPAVIALSAVSRTSNASAPAVLEARD